MPKKPDMINEPPHYAKFDPEPIDVIIGWGFGEGFCLGAAIKYIARHRDKGKAIEDLKKARWFLDRWIQELEEAGNVNGK